MLMCLKYLICGKKGPDLTSNKLESFCKQIIDICKDLNEESLNYFKSVEDVIKQAGEVDRDKLKTQSYAEDLKRIIYSR